MKSALTNPALKIRPSTQLQNYIFNLKSYPDAPSGILYLKSGGTPKLTKRHAYVDQFLMTNEDYTFIKSLDLNQPQSSSVWDCDDLTEADSDKLLCLDDLHWLHDKLSKEGKKLYLHELLEGSTVVLPKNPEIPRSEALEKRCQRLKAQMLNRAYKAMTKNVDNVRQHYPEDTISYQLKHLNRQLIAVFQFIISVAAGFAFGFCGIELIIGTQDFGFRLLLGVIFALIIALAELYFLAKKLNEDLQFEVDANKKLVHPKID